MDEDGPSPSPALARVKSALRKGQLLIVKRQKLIHIADHSEIGWAVVSKYTADRLAEESGDEERLEKAEKAAEQKIEKSRKKRANSARSRVQARIPSMRWGYCGHAILHATSPAPIEVFYGAGAGPVSSPQRDGPPQGKSPETVILR